METCKNLLRDSTAALRRAPLIGVMAAYGVALAMRHHATALHT